MELLLHSPGRSDANVSTSLVIIARTMMIIWLLHPHDRDFIIWLYDDMMMIIWLLHPHDRDFIRLKALHWVRFHLQRRGLWRELSLLLHQKWVLLNTFWCCWSVVEYVLVLMNSFSIHFGVVECWIGFSIQQYSNIVLYICVFYFVCIFFYLHI